MELLSGLGFCCCMTVDCVKLFDVDIDSLYTHILALKSSCTDVLVMCVSAAD